MSDLMTSNAHSGNGASPVVQESAPVGGLVPLSAAGAGAASVPSAQGPAARIPEEQMSGMMGTNGSSHPASVASSSGVGSGGGGADGDASSINTNLYITGVPRHYQHKDLFDLFAKYGSIIASRLLADRNGYPPSGGSAQLQANRGVAFVRYSSVESCHAAIRALHGKVLPDASEALSVKFANENHHHDRQRAAAETQQQQVAVAAMGYAPQGFPMGMQRASYDTGRHGHGASALHYPAAPHNPNWMAAAAAGSPASSNSWHAQHYPTGAAGGMHDMKGTAAQHQSMGYASHGLGSSGASADSGNGSAALGMLAPQSVDYGGMSMGLADNRPRFAGGYGGRGRGRGRGGGGFSRGGGGAGGGYGAYGRMGGDDNSAYAAASAYGAPQRGMMPAPYDYQSYPGRMPAAPYYAGPAGAVGAGAGAGGGGAGGLAQHGSGGGVGPGAVSRNGYALFVFHLPPTVTDSDLHQLFALHGTVTAATVMRDQATGSSRGYGFVSMLKYEDAVRAIENLNGFALGNKFLKVSFKKESNRQRGGHRGGGGGGAHGGMPMHNSGAGGLVPHAQAHGHMGGMAQHGGMPMAFGGYAQHEQQREHETGELGLDLHHDRERAAGGGGVVGQQPMGDTDELAASLAALQMHQAAKAANTPPGASAGAGSGAAGEQLAMSQGSGPAQTSPGGTQSPPDQPRF
jgi:RNA recognition motif-containing protein